MRADSRPVNITLNLPSLPDEAVVEIQDLLYEILDLFMTHYGRQIDHFYDGLSYESLVHPESNPKSPVDDQAF